MDKTGSDARTPPKPTLLARLGRWCHDNRRTVSAIWFGAIAALVLTVGVVGGNFSTTFDTPDSESRDGFDLIDEYFGGQGSGIPGRVVFRTDGSVTEPRVQEPMQTYLDELAAQQGITVVSPYSERGFGQISSDASTAFATVEASDSITDATDDVGSDLRVLAPTVDGVQIEFGGNLFVQFDPPQSEVLGVGFAIFILIAAFGSVVAMGLPIGVALGGIASGTLLVSLLSNLITVPSFTSVLGLMIGLGVGIDYSLFIVTRYRDELRSGKSSSDAAARALDTAGRAVLFAGVTVVISLLGLLLIGLPFFQGVGAGASLTVLVTMIASITLLPALLGFVGPRIEVTRMRGLVAAVLVALTLASLGLGVPNPVVMVLALAALATLALGAVVPRLRDVLPSRAVKPIETTLPYRWSRLVQRYSLPMAVIGTTVLLAITIPAFSLRLGFGDDGNLSEDNSARKAYDLLADGFGPGFNGPILLVAELPAGPVDLGAVTAEIAAFPGIAEVTSPFPNDPQTPTAVLWQAYPKTSPQDVETQDLVRALREDAALAGAQSQDVDVLVTGSVALGEDFSEFLAGRLPLFFAAVLLLSFVLLMTVFRSVLVALKAVVMNMLSIGAAYGMVVMVFQWGWGGELIGLGRGGPIEPFIPMMLFAVVFGLSMDYEIFLLSRVREEWQRDGDNARAVADGLASTARLITAAAAIMVFVFGSFLLEDLRIIKLFGFGLAAAILLDATVVRLLLVPATMELLGDRNWWLPRWLDRVLPRIDIAGHHDDGIDPPPSDGQGDSPRHSPPGSDPEADGRVLVDL